MRFKSAGDTVKIGLMRDGEAKEIDVKTGAFPDEFTVVGRASRGTEEKPAEPVKAKLLGMTVQDLDEDLAKRFEIEEENGVIVVAVEKGSAAAEKNISPGDIVTRINSTSVDSVASFNDATEELDLKKGVLVHLNSDGSQRFEVLKEYDE